jgi:hypothetical protein
MRLQRFSRKNKLLQLFAVLNCMNTCYVNRLTYKHIWLVTSKLSTYAFVPTDFEKNNSSIIKQYHLGYMQGGSILAIPIGYMQGGSTLAIPIGYMQSVEIVLDTLLPTGLGNNFLRTRPGYVLM